MSEGEALIIAVHAVELAACDLRVMVARARLAVRRAERQRAGSLPVRPGLRDPPGLGLVGSRHASACLSGRFCRLRPRPASLSAPSTATGRRRAASSASPGAPGLRPARATLPHPLPGGGLVAAP